MGVGFRVSALGFRGLGVWGLGVRGGREPGPRFSVHQVSAERKSSSRTRV